MVSALHIIFCFRFFHVGFDFGCHFIMVMIVVIVFPAKGSRKEKEREIETRSKVCDPFPRDECDLNSAAALSIELTNELILV